MSLAVRSDFSGFHLSREAIIYWPDLKGENSCESAKDLCRLWLSAIIRFIHELSIGTAGLIIFANSFDLSDGN
jgi:hypothetical protein